MLSKSSHVYNSLKMLVETWPIERIKPYERNARKIPQKAVDKVAASLKEYGWRQPIVVDEQGVILAGHTRRLGAIQNGWTEAPVHVAAGLSSKQQRAYRLMDNRSHEEASWDMELLAPELAELKAMDFDLGLTGFDETIDVKKEKHVKAHLSFAVIIDCTGEDQQTQLLDRFETEGLQCRALIS